MHKLNNNRYRYDDIQSINVYDNHIQSINIQEDRFGFEPEITAKIARRNCRIYEVAISYSGRTAREGKKIGWKDGLRAVYCIVKYAVVSR